VLGHDGERNLNPFFALVRTTGIMSN